MKSIKQEFDKLIKLYPKKILYSNLISKRDIDLLENKLNIILPEEFKIYLTNYKLNLFNSDFDILSIKEIIEETNFIRSLERDKNFLVISRYDDFILSINLSSKGKNGWCKIFEVNPDCEDYKLACDNLYDFLEEIIRGDIEWEDEVNKEEKDKP